MSQCCQKSKNNICCETNLVTKLVPIRKVFEFRARVNQCTIGIPSHRPTGGTHHSPIRKTSRTVSGQLALSATVMTPDQLRTSITSLPPPGEPPCWMTMTIRTILLPRDTKGSKKKLETDVLLTGRQKKGNHREQKNRRERENYLPQSLIWDLGCDAYCWLIGITWVWWREVSDIVPPRPPPYRVTSAMVSGL